MILQGAGSWFFLGEIVTAVEIEADAPATDHCGTCARCIPACPTGAIVAPWTLDATRCISYLTIEHRGPIPLELRPLIGTRIFGCDDCQEVCPWNRFATPSAHPDFAERPEQQTPELIPLLALDEPAFRARFDGTAIRRAGRDRFVRNVAVALGNLGDRARSPRSSARRGRTGASMFASMPRGPSRGSAVSDAPVGLASPRAEPFAAFPERALSPTTRAGNHLSSRAVPSRKSDLISEGTPMKRLATLIALSLSIVMALPAPSRAGMITFTQDKTKVSGYLALPEGEGTHPALIVVQEWWGLNDWVKQQADSLAKYGYIALAVDLYKGKVANTQEMAHQLMSGLAEDEGIDMLRAGADFLRGRSDVRAQAVGVIGWCMGGGYAIRLAAADPGIRACVMYYGTPIHDEAKIRGIQASILGNFGGDDKGVQPDDVKQFETALKKAGKSVDFKVYPGAGHAFANPNNPWGGYREEAAKDAWARTLAFLKRDLKTASLPKGGKKS